MAVYKDSASYAAGDSYIHTRTFSVSNTTISSSISSSINYEYSGSTPIASSSVNNIINTTLESEWSKSVKSNSNANFF